MSVDGAVDMPASALAGHANRTQPVGGDADPGGHSQVTHGLARLRREAEERIEQLVRLLADIEASRRNGRRAG